MCLKRPCLLTIPEPSRRRSQVLGRAVHMSDACTVEEWLDARIEEGRRVVCAILNQPRLSFQGLRPCKLPEEPGLYVISLRDTREVLRAGRTEKQTLRDRVYHDHLMGSQQGNLRAQLVRGEVCSDLQAAKEWIRQHCVVQWLENDRLGSAWISDGPSTFSWPRSVQGSAHRCF